MTDEAVEGRNAFLEKRKPNFDKKWIPWIWRMYYCGFPRCG
jgi:hypothetical protein